MKSIIFSALFVLVPLFCGCGSSEATDKAVRQSHRYYEAGFVSWFEEHDNLLAIRNLTRSIDANPQNDLAHYLLGSIRGARGEYDEAEKHLRIAVRVRSETEPVKPSELADAQNALGVVLINTKKYDEAVELLSLASKEVLNREPWIATGNLGWAYIELGEYDKAIESLKRAIFDQPKFCVGMYRLGQAYYMKKEWTTADNVLTQAVSTTEAGCDMIQEAYYFMGMARMRLEKDAGAREAFKKCFEIQKISEIGAKCSEALSGL